jgi:dolichol-phosphate mannosyltransferase
VAAVPDPLRPLVVIPTYQEAENIADVQRRVRAAAPTVAVLVVDDASPDGTAELAEATGREVSEVSVLRRPGKAGLGAAYRAGFEWGIAQGYDVLVEMDADLSHDPSDVPRLLAAVAEGADLAIGSRYVPGGATPDWPVHRRLISRLGNVYAGAVLGLAVNDATAGFRAYRATLLETIDYPTTHADGYGFQVEMAYRVHQHGGTIREIPITFSDRVRGTSKMSTRIVVEAMVLVTWWAIRDRVLRRGRRR